MAVASTDGRYLVSIDSVNPGNDGKNPCLSARLRVDRAGENNAAWANAIKSARVFDGGLMAGSAWNCIKDHNHRSDTYVGLHHL